MNPWLLQHRQAILDAASRHGVRQVRVFGSMARDTAQDASDLDLLVELDPQRGLLDQIAFQQELEARLDRKVDVATPKGLHWYIRDRVLAEAQPL